MSSTYQLPKRASDPLAASGGHNIGAVTYNTTEELVKVSSGTNWMPLANFDVTYRQQNNGELATESFFVASRPCKVVAVKEIHSSSAGQITGVTVTAPGTGFTAIPTVVFTSASGSGAAGTAKLKAISAVIGAAGTGYNVADTITLAGGTSTAAAVLNVATVKVVSASVGDSGGTGYTANDVLTVAGGTGTAATITVATVDGGGAITGVTVTTAGSYTVRPTITNNVVTGGTGTGAHITLVTGVGTYTVNTAGSYSALPANPVAQASTSGSGTGATATVTWGVASVAVSASGSGYLTAPAVTFTGSGSGATGVGVLSESDGQVDIQLTKDTGTAAPGTGTALLTNNSNGGFNTVAPINRVQSGTLTGTAASLLLAAGDRLSAKFTGTLDGAAGIVMTVQMAYA